MIVTPESAPPPDCLTLPLNVAMSPMLVILMSFCVGLFAANALVESFFVVYPVPEAVTRTGFLGGLLLLNPSTM